MALGGAQRQNKKIIESRFWVMLKSRAVTRRGFAAVPQELRRLSVLIIYCSITIHLKIVWLRTTDIYYLIISVGQESRHNLAGCTAYCHKAVINVLTGLHSHRGLSGEGFVSKCIQLWAKFIPLSYMTEVLDFCLLSTRGQPQVLQTPYSSLFLQHGHFLHQTKNESLSNTCAIFYWLEANHTSQPHSREAHIRL